MEHFECWFRDICEEECPVSGCSRYRTTKWQMDNAGLPEAQQRVIKLTSKSDEEREIFGYLGEIKKNIVQHVKDGDNFYICSNATGNGKTSWAIKLLQAYLASVSSGNIGILRGIFISVPDLLIKIKDFSDPITSKNLIEKIQKVDLVIWDDVVISGLSNFDYLQLYNLINNRLFAKKSNIYTSNYEDRNTLQELIGARLTSRIWNDSEIIKFVGLDRRGK